MTHQATQVQRQKAPTTTVATSGKADRPMLAKFSQLLALQRKINRPRGHFCILP